MLTPGCASSPPPRWATARNPDRPTFGPAVGKVATALGVPPMPWQKLVHDVGCEVIPDDSERGWSWAYRLVVVTVQRQAGKTGGLLTPIHTHRALTQPRSTYLTAQTRQAARDIWLDAVQRVRRSPMAALATVRESNGSEGIAFPSGGSYRAFAPTVDALHGRTNELVSVDEGWAFDLAEGVALEQAILPTFTTTGGQLWLPSTAGHGGSLWLRGYVDRGRAAVEQGRQDGVAYFEWSLPPDVAAAVRAGLDSDRQADVDAALELVLAHHPAAGRTLDLGALRVAAETMTPDQFLRAYGNVWTATSDRVIPEHAWDACLDEDWPPPAGQVALAFDVAMDRSSAAIGVGWRDSDTGPLRVDVIDAHPGDSWLVPRLRELAGRWRHTQLAHNGGPALDAADELARGGNTVRQLTAPEYATACATFLSSTLNRRLTHPGRPALDDAVAVAATRPLGEAWAWSRRGSTGSIAALVATTVAGWAYDHRPPVRRAVVVAARR